jgi:hypothetical protein
MAQLDALLLAVEDFNDRYEPGTTVPLSWATFAAALGCQLRWPMTGGRLHAALLARQEVLMVPVYEVHYGKLHRLTETGSLPTALRRDDVREIA